MGINYEDTLIYWNYFLSIESDFETTARYVEFNAANNETFSIAFARIIMAATQDVDGILKEICHLIETDRNPKNINQYKEIITSKVPTFSLERVYIPKYGMSSIPWENWSQSNNNPIWWKANNNLKHNRIAHFQDANLKNAFNALGALLITTLYFYKLKADGESDIPFNWRVLTMNLRPKSSILQLKPEYYNEPVMAMRNDW